MKFEIKEDESMAKTLKRPYFMATMSGIKEGYMLCVNVSGESPKEAKRGVIDAVKEMVSDIEGLIDLEG